MSGRPDDAQTVAVRVQVIDMDSFTLDLRVPTFLPARDLTQRVARDAGLEAYWEKGRRRLYWLRARGRVLRDDETLGDLGVVGGELVYLLPEPPADSGVLEQVPDYPETHDYAGKGILNLVAALVGTMLWAVLWGAALTVSSELDIWAIMLPGLGLGVCCLSVSRHMWGGAGDQDRIPVTAIIIFLLLFVLAFLPTVFLAPTSASHPLSSVVLEVYSLSVPGFIMGMIGIFVGWLAWWGSVEPLPETRQEREIKVARPMAVECGLCGQAADPDVQKACNYGCGRVFHSGCYNARMAVYRGDPGRCAVCDARVG